MTPNPHSPDSRGDLKGVVESDPFKSNNVESRIIGTDKSYKHKIVWSKAITFLLLHLFGLWGFLLLLSGAVQLKTFVLGLFIAMVGGEGITVGAHRLFTHRCFKATPLLKAILIVAHTSAGEDTMFIWCRDHRLHHRYSDTDGDPYNAKRGFFFSHIGWTMNKKHPLVLELGKKIDMSDLEADWMVMFQKKYYIPLYFIFGLLIPVWLPIYFFNEDFKVALLFCYFFRYILQLNATWLVNSAAHLYGTRPYDKKIQPVESWFVSFFTLGEGWHNYHHAFPWDYKAAELPNHINLSTRVINFFAKIGMAYDLKTVTDEMMINRIKRTGDGTHSELGTEESRAAVKAVGPLHPLNPSYTVTYKDPEATLKITGLPLYHENDIFDCSNATITKHVK